MTANNQTQLIKCAVCIEAGLTEAEAFTADYLPEVYFCEKPICHECYLGEVYSNDYPSNYKADYLGVLGN